jgi:hypothetical protein
MIRPFTCLCLAAACGSGLYLYSEKHRTAMLDREISGVIRQTEAARARTGLLRAEWALLNEPGRLQDMADKYLALKPMAPTQFVQLSELAAHLPPPEAAYMATADDAGDDGSAPDAAAPAAAAAPAIAADAATQEPPDDAAAATIALPARRLAMPKDDLPAAPKLLAKADIKPRPAHRATPAYTPHEGMLAQGAPLPLAAPQPVGAHVYSAMARPVMQPAYRPPVVSATPHYVSPYVGSALGGRGTLPPPTPYGGAQ